MNWVTTNIRLPEDTYMELRMEAARKRTSIARLIRAQLIKKTDRKKSGARKVERFMKKVQTIAKANEKKLKGINLTKALIEMRYEQ